MNNFITDTSEIAETEWDGHSEPSEVGTDMVATVEAENRGIEFHVSMRDYTQRDMEALIVEAAANMIVGRRNDREIAKQIEAKCIELVAHKADAALEKITNEIMDQPITPAYGDKAPITMREFVGLTGREYFATRVDRSTGQPPSRDSYRNDGPSRAEYLVSKYMQTKFTTEIEKATNAAISEIQGLIRAKHNEILAAEKKRIQEALAKATAV